MCLQLCSFSRRSSMQMMNRYPAMGSPCLQPLPTLILGVGYPFIRIEDWKFLSSCCVILAHLTNDKSNQNRWRQVISFGLEPHFQRSSTNDPSELKVLDSYDLVSSTFIKLWDKHSSGNLYCMISTLPVSLDLWWWLPQQLYCPCPFVQPVPTYSLFV